MFHVMTNDGMVLSSWPSALLAIASMDTFAFELKETLYVIADNGHIIAAQEL